jgi:UDP-glucose 4-epimerase
MTSPVLITGGAGFIGSHLVDRFAATGRSVVVLDDLSSGRAENLEPALGTGFVELVEGDAADAELVAALAARASGLVHLAASVGVRQVVSAPGRTLRNNLSTTLAVTAAARRFRLPLLFASTSEVYGKSDALPFHEGGDLVLGTTTKGRWSYAAAKATGEWLVLSEAHEGGFEAVVTRLFNTVGPRQRGRYGMVLPRFVAAAQAGEPLEVHGDGRQTRCFAHVEDVTASLLALFDRLAQGQLGARRVFNVGTDEEVSIFRLAKAVRAAAASDSPIRLVPYDEAFGADSGFEDMRRRVPSLVSLDRELGGAPRRPLAAIIDELVAGIPATGSR